MGGAGCRAKGLHCQWTLAAHNAAAISSATLRTSARPDVTAVSDDASKAMASQQEQRLRWRRRSAATSGIAIAALDASARAAKSEAPSGSQPTRPNVNAAEAFTDWPWASLTSVAWHDSANPSDRPRTLVWASVRECHLSVRSPTQSDAGTRTSIRSRRRILERRVACDRHQTAYICLNSLTDISESLYIGVWLLPDSSP
jgi:hypothetical protein